MKVKRIVANIETAEIKKVSEFYQSLFGLDLLMNLGWINTVGSNETMPVQLSVASEGGSGTQVPTLSIEVDDLETIIDRAR